MRKSLLIFSLAAMVSVAAFAEDAKPVAIGPYIHADHPYGTGNLSRLFISVYDASVWTDAPQWSMNAPFALVIHYHLSIDGEDFVNRSIEEMQHEQSLSDDKVAMYKQELARVLPDVKRDDTLVALYDPQKGIRFFHNDKPVGSIRDHELATRFLAIWFSPETSEPSLREGLLGKSHG